MFGPKITKGDFVLYRELFSTDIELKPARVQYFSAATVALCDVTGVKVQAGNEPARIVCGPVKWFETGALKIYHTTESALLTAPTAEGVKI